MKMSEKIIKIREQLNINRSEFARKINIDVAAVWRWEKGERMPSNIAMSGICKAFNVNSKWLIDDDLKADMFLDISNKALKQLSHDYDLQNEDEQFIKSYLSANHEKRKAINSVVKF